MYNFDKLIALTKATHLNVSVVRLTLFRNVQLWPPTQYMSFLWNLQTVVSTYSSSASTPP